MTTRADVDRVLAAVRDPELDRSIVELEFVRDVAIEGRDVRVELRLPTYWCSANFAYIMAEDARDAVAGLPDVDHVEVTLIDHFVSEEVNTGINQGRPFEEAFPDLADGGLDEVRRTFDRKAFVVRQAAALGAARKSLADEQVVAWTLGQGAPPGASPDVWDEYLVRRSALGMSLSPDMLAFTTVKGEPLETYELDLHLRMARTVRVSIQANVEFCTGLLAARYHEGVEAWQKKEVAA
jgi:metal-sulfur cluster biosynthetic enzyme